MPMKLANYIYYCIYRFVLKTPARSDADAWAIVFLALTLGIHMLTGYFIITQLAGADMASSAQLKEIGVAAFIVLIVLFFVHYVMNGNGLRVISSFEKLASDAKYARVGAIMFVETLLLPLTLSCLLILWTKLSGR